MAGTPEKMLEHLLESRLDNRNETEIGKKMNYVNILCPMVILFHICREILKIKIKDLIQLISN